MWRVFREQRLKYLFLLLLSLIFFWVFFEVADEALEQEYQKLDESLIYFFRQASNPSETIGPPWLKEAMLNLSALGSTAVLCLTILLTAGYLLLAKDFFALILILVSAIGGGALSYGFKAFFDRPRPDLVLHLEPVSSPSFPSGHSALSAVIFLTLGVLLAHFEKRKLLRAYFIGAALLLTFIVGLSRVFIGVHFPSDVLGGWCLGLAWALLCWIVARGLRI